MNFGITTGMSESNTALERVVIVQNKMGIHARPAAMIVRVANKFKGDVWVEKDDEQVNGKSIMGLMMLAAGKGSRLTFRVGSESSEPNAAQAVLDEMEQLFERRFEEA